MQLIRYRKNQCIFSNLLNDVNKLYNIRILSLNITMSLRKEQTEGVSEQGARDNFWI